MNMIYRIDWNSRSGTWMVVSELARGRRRHVAAAGPVVALVTAFIAMGETAWAASTGNGALQLCEGAKNGSNGYGYGYGISAATTANCNDGREVSFTLYNNASGNAGTGGWGGADTRITGYKNGSLEFKSSAISLLGAVSFDRDASLGSHKITNLANGLASGDAAAIGQLSPAVNALGGGAKLDPGTGRVTGPAYSLANGGNQTTVGGALAKLDDAITAARSYLKLNPRDIARDAAATGFGAIAIGDAAVAGKAEAPGSANAIAIGMTAKAEGNQSIGLGRLSEASGALSMALGDSAKSRGENALALGASASVDATAKNGVAIGADAVVAANATDSVAIGSGSSASGVHTVSVGSSTRKRSIVNVADGVLAATSSDAVTGRQLFATNQEVANNRQDIAANSSGIGSLKGQIGDGSIGLVRWDAVGRNVTVAAELDGDTVDVSGKQEGKVRSRKVTGVSDGTLSSTSNDAVTGRQLFATNQEVASNRQDIAANSRGIGSLKGQIGNGSIGLVRWDAVGKNITVAAELDGDTVDVSGKQEGKVQSRKVTGVSDGTLSGTSSDAVTGRQLFATNQDVAANSTRIGDLREQLGDGSIGLVRWDAASKNITVAAELDGDAVDVSGKQAGRAQSRKVTGVSDGVLSSASSDAVTGKQLFATNQEVAGNRQNIAANSSSIGKLQQQLGDGSVGLVQQDAASRNITVAAGLDGDALDLAGKKDGVPHSRKLISLSAGALSDSSTEAVNGAQLHATNQHVAANRSDIGQLQSQLGSGAIGLVRQDAATRVITVGNGYIGGNVDFRGADGSRVLSGIANGTKDDDAVTVAQLKAAGTGPLGKPRLSTVYDDPSLSSVSLGGSGGTVIRNLGGGAVAPGSMDAVNGGQLYDLRQSFVERFDLLNGRVGTLNQQVVAIQQSVAGGALGGKGTGRRSTLLGEGASASGDDSTAIGAHAMASGAGSTATGAKAVASGQNSVAGGAGAKAVGAGSVALGADSSAAAADSVALGSGSVAERGHTVSVGAPGQERQVTHVAAGTARTDAANWGQVRDAMQEVQHWARDRFRQASRQANAGAAAAIAMTNIPQAYAPNQSALGAGIGSFNGQAALAVGLSTVTPGGRWVFKGSLANNTQGDLGAGVGAAIIW